MATIGKDVSPDVGKATQFKPGQVANPKGRPVGSRSLSATIQDLLEDDDFEVQLKNGEKLKGRPSRKMSEVMYKLALSGNVKAYDVLAKYGYGTKVDITSGGEKIELPAVYLPQRKKDDDVK
jgi:hypothetical protein